MEFFADSVLKIDEGDIGCVAMWIPPNQNNKEKSNCNNQ
jgi:hypothetical protein